jgi:hypothetical protein
MDPDPVPGCSKIYGSGGSGSGTLVRANNVGGVDFSSVFFYPYLLRDLRF